MNIREIFVQIEPYKAGQWHVQIMPVGGHTFRSGLTSALIRTGLDGYENWNEVVHGMAPTAVPQLTGLDLRALGEHIWKALLVETGLVEELGGYVEAGTVRQMLAINEAGDPVLAMLPAELAWDGGQHPWKAGAVRVSVNTRAAPPVRLEAGTRLLIATAASAGREPDAQTLAIHAQRVAASARALGWVVTHLPEATEEALAEALSQPEGTDVLYLVAHGEADPNTFGRLALANGPLEGTMLKSLLRDTQASPRPCRAVVLAACSGALHRPTDRDEITGMVQTLVRDTVPAAIGFRALVGVDWTLKFMEKLFAQLGRTPDLEAAFAATRAGLDQNDPQWPLAVYYGRPLLTEVAASSATQAVSRVLRDVLPGIEARAYFTARNAELDQLATLLRTPGKAVIHALEGEGGIGKSELARVVVGQVKGTRPIIWLDRPDTQPRAALEAMLSAVPNEASASYLDWSDERLGARVQARLEGQGGLLVLDDVAQPDALPPFPADWNVLVTTRVASLLPDAARIELGPLSRDEARTLFCRVAWSAEAPPSSEADALETLLQYLEDRPLALELAATTVRFGTTVAAYQASLGAGFGPAWADEARLRAVLSRNLDQMGDDERAAFEALGALPVSGVDALMVALTLGWPEGRATRALDTLTRHRAARYAVETSRYGLHPRLREEARARLKARQVDWDRVHDGVAKALAERARHAWEPLRRQPGLAMARWAPLADLFATLDLQPWRDGAPGALVVLDTLAYVVSDLRDRNLGVAHRREAHQVTADFGRAVLTGLCVEAAGPAAGTAFVRLGDAMVALGDGAAAREAYNLGFRIHRQVLEQDPGSAEGLRDIALSFERQGDLALRSGDGAGAQVAFEKGLGIAQRRVAQAPESAEALRDQSVFLCKLGDLALRAGNRAGAQAMFDRGLDSVRRLVAQDPHSAEALRDLSVFVCKVGDLALRRGDGAAARLAFEECLGISRQLVVQGLESAESQRDVSVLLSKLGELAMQNDDVLGARAALEESVGIDRQLAERDPESARAWRDLSVGLEKLGDLEMRAEDRERAQAAYDEGLKIRRRLVAQDPESAVALRDLVVSLFLRSRVDLSERRLGDARAYLAEAAERARILFRQTGGEADSYHVVVTVLATLAEVLAATGDEAGAAAIRAELAGLPALPEEAP